MNIYPLIPLFAGIITGFLLSIPPGPINFIVLESGFRKNKREYLLLSLGGSNGDTFYTIIAIFWRFSQEYISFLKLFFNFLVGTFLLMVGFLYLKNSLEIDKFEKSVEKKSYKYNPYFKGLLFSLANPLFIITMIAIVELYFSIGILKLGILHGILFSIGIGIGTFSWLTVVGIISHRVLKFRNFSEKKMKKVMSLSFTLLGIYFLLKFLRLLLLK